MQSLERARQIFKQPVGLASKKKMEIITKVSRRQPVQIPSFNNLIGWHFHAQTFETAEHRKALLHNVTDDVKAHFRSVGHDVGRNPRMWQATCRPWMSRLHYKRPDVELYNFLGHTEGEYGVANVSPVHVKYGLLCDVKPQWDRHCKYNATLRSLRESLLPWKSNKYYIFVCACVCM